MSQMALWDECLHRADVRTCRGCHSETLQSTPDVAQRCGTKIVTMHNRNMECIEHIYLYGVGDFGYFLLRLSRATN